MVEQLIKSLTKYSAIMRTQIINSAAYPLDLATRSLMMVLFMFIFMQLWTATYRAMGQSTIAGLCRCKLQVSRSKFQLETCNLKLNLTHESISYT